ncbi:DUF2922 domain-containing protein [Aerococcaceae bacterium DSM 111022]|nr:DUF2922 domain-containing protein [Aerococcaceae bacterium DSM 111022]
MTTNLELLFKDANGKSRKITVKSPKEGLTPAQAQTALDNIVQANVFIGNEGEDIYAEAVGAQYVSRSVETVYEQPAA